MHTKLGYIFNPDTQLYYITDSIKVPTLSPGLYQVEEHDNASYYKQLDIDASYIIELPSSPIKLLQEEIHKFWNQPEEFNKFKLLHKRGILLHGQSAVGKTSCIIKLVDYIIKEKAGIVFLCNQFDSSTREAIQRVRKLEPNRVITCVLDPLESILMQEQLLNYEVLDFLDGVNGINHSLFIAAAMNIGSLPDMIKKKPSRFDLQLELDDPTDIDREFYFKKMIPAKELKKIDLDKWVLDTKGFPISSLKDLILSHFVFKNKYPEAIKTITSYVKSKKKLGY